MRSFIQLLCVLMLGVAGIGGAFAWLEHRPNNLVWVFRIGAIALALISIAILLAMDWRKDLVRDYLHERFGNYFERNGLCFMAVVAMRGGVCYFDLYFQNRFERPCNAKIALRPAGSSGARKNWECYLLTYDISCPPAGVGIASIPIYISAALRGSELKFDIGATVKYPDGKGRMLRFRDAAMLRANVEFRNRYYQMLTILGLCGAVWVNLRQPQLYVCLPQDINEELPPTTEQTTKILWRLDDLPLNDRFALGLS